MAKGHSDHHHQQDQGTPTYIIMSVLFTIVIFALEGIKETINLHGADSQTQATTLGFIGLGLSICFFWRRLHDSIFKTMTALFFTASLWAYLVATIALPLLALGEDVTSRLQLIHQCGLGGVVIAGFSLMAALLYHQKPIPALLMTTFAGFLVAFGSLYPLLRPGSVSIQQEFSIENHGQRSSKKIEIVEEDVHKTESEHPEVGEGHEEPQLAHDVETKEDGNAHGHAKVKAKATKHADKAQGSKKSIMKLSAHAAVENEDEGEGEGEDESEERIHKVLREANENGEDEGQKPRTLTAAQKAKLERRDYKPLKTTSHSQTHSKPKFSPAAKAPASHGPHWEYAGESGPEQWGELADGFKLCSTGLEQSPINIMNGWSTRNAIDLDYKPSTFQVLDNGHTVQVNVERGNFATIDNQRYELKQFHFHTPSEHLVEGKPYQMEVHFVHANEQGQLAVIGAFINPGKTHKEYQQVWEFMPVKPNQPIKPYNITLDLRRLLPSTLTAFHYAGSLTTPPCSEQVNWNVLYTTLKLSQDQINIFKKKYQMNARPAQPLNYRRP